MRKEELERRSAELKARMLAQRNAGRESFSAVAKSKSVKKAMETTDSSAVELSDNDGDINALKKRITELEKENERLRQQVAMLSTRTFGNDRSSTNSVREQRHNFFKYSNIRRY